jgi:hypothetical protein
VEPTIPLQWLESTSNFGEPRSYGAILPLVRSQEEDRPLDPRAPQPPPAPAATAERRGLPAVTGRISACSAAVRVVGLRLAIPDRRVRIGEELKLPNGVDALYTGGWSGPQRRLTMFESRFRTIARLAVIVGLVLPIVGAAKASNPPAWCREDCETSCEVGNMTNWYQCNENCQQYLTSPPPIYVNCVSACDAALNACITGCQSLPHCDIQPPPGGGSPPPGSDPKKMQLVIPPSNQ